MPKINRIRIINFSYNNNNRHIIDETFDFYGGENALLSLANGGGKSVLVQVMLQPILPKVTMLGRKFSDFFQGRSSEPSYIMIEWKLDDEAGYFLTGIAIAKSTSELSGEEEQNTSIKYYTFMKAYEEANEFDIKHIPVTEEINNKIRIASFNEFNKFLKRESEKKGQNVYLFKSEREEQQEYERKLQSYGISKDEWKEIMVKINENEHGVAEVFSKCRTSRAVMEQWIIRYIEKVLNKSKEGDHKKLENMMYQVASSLVENESHIKDYKIIDGFLIGIIEMGEKTKEVLDKLDIEEKIRNKIIESYYSLIIEEERLKLLNISYDERIRELRNELELIEIEEISKEIHQTDVKIKETDKLLNNLDKNIEEVKEKRAQIDYNHKTQIAAEKYQQVRTKQKRIASLNERLLNESKNEEQLLRDINKIKYSLKIKYEDKLALYNGNINKLLEKDNVLKEIFEENKLSIKTLQNEIICLSQGKGSLVKEIEIFEKEEVRIFKSLNISLYRNAFLKELDLNEVEGIRKNILVNIENIKENINLNNNKIQQLEKEVESLRKELDDISRIKLDNTLDLNRISKDIEDYLKEKEIVINVLNTYRIEESDIFNKGMILKLINEKKNDWTDKEFRLRNQIIDLEKLINGIKDGNSYLPEGLVSILKERDIQIYTGEKYLRDIDEEKKIQLLKENPFLSYSLIVNEKEYTELLNAIEDTELTSIIPVIRYNHKDDILSNSLGVIEFITNPRSMNIDSKDLGVYLNGLNDDKIRLQEEMVETLKVIEKCNEEFQIITHFNYKKEDVERLYSDKKNILKTIDELETLEKTKNEEKNKVESNIKELTKSIQSLEKELDRENSRYEKFEEYLLKNEGYISNIRKLEELNNDIEINKIKIKKLEDSNSDIQNELNELKIMIRNEEDSKEKILENFSKVKDAVITEGFIDESIEELEGKLSSYEKSRGQQISEINTQIQDAKKDIEIITNEINDLRVDENDYIDLSFSKELKKQYGLKLESLSEEIEKLDKEYRIKDNEKASLIATKEQQFKNIRDKDLILMEDIKGNFNERKENTRKEIASKEEYKTKNYKKEKSLTEIKLRTEYIIPAVKNLSFTENPMIIDNIIEHIETLHKNYEDSKNKTNLEIDSFNIKSNNFRIENNSLKQSTCFSALNSIVAHIDALDKSFDKYYYLYERFQAYIDQLTKIKIIMDEKMNQLTYSQNDLIEHAFMEAERIYDEIPKISENSSVEIDGVKRKILDIRFDEMTDRSLGREKMNYYIHECLDSLTSLIKDDVDENKIRKEIEKIISTKELLNVLSNLDKCVVRSYKVDINEKNRKMMSWEDVIIKNSGGEKFVAYFSLLVALISYSRKNIRNMDVFRKKENSKVLIMDNPFGAITSDHLLKPLFDIAKKYNTQLICLSDIKQGSVVNSFDLVYMIKIRQNMMKEDFVELETIPKAELKRDERLEKAYIYSTVEQMNLFN